MWGRWRRGAALAGDANGRRLVKSRGAGESAARKKKKVQGRLTHGVRVKGAVAAGWRVRASGPGRARGAGVEQARPKRAG